jgi:hypothetical protein
MQYATKSMRDWWNSDADSSDPAARARLLSVRLSLVRALHQAHAKLLAGTDTPHPFVLPELSLHDELHNFIAAGLTPYENPSQNCLRRMQMAASWTKPRKLIG